MLIFLSLQRNHTLFGSVWSSMRKQKPFSRNRMLKSGNNNNNNVTNNNAISLATSAVHNMASTTAALSSDYLGSDYGKISNNTEFVQRDRLADGLNNITKSILQQRGVSGQLEQRDDIPLRPLLLNGSQNQGNPANNTQGQNNEWVWESAFQPSTDTLGSAYSDVSLNFSTNSAL